ncbi:MAG: outer membrane protein assembly factor BamA [Proteobacteria bacterium]|nr:outer membrane protein assembly factor BamA [Desulfobulbaceae bacterium]MBU4152753.1 outer membrane protein assembly factor BamA [Pseudomonadota bacterium]
MALLGKHMGGLLTVCLMAMTVVVLPLPAAGFGSGGLLAMLQGASSAENKQPGWDIVVSGNQTLETESLLAAAREELNTFVHQGYAASAIDDAAFVIETQYRHEGYATAIVDYEIKEQSRQVVFRVQEGPRTVLKDIVFVGNQGLGRERLLALDPVVDAEIKGQRTFPYVAATMSSLADSIKSLYLAEGYLQVKIKALEPGPMEGRPDDMVASIAVEEGPRFTLKDVTVHGDVPGDLGDAVSEIVKAMEGHVYQRRQRLVLRTKLRDAYANAGYADVAVSVQETIAESQGLIHLEAMVESGLKVIVDEIRVDGNERTNSDFILSRLNFEPGAQYRQDDKREGFGSLYGTGLFSNVELRLVDGAVPGHKTVEIEVEERKARELYLEPGWGSYELLRLKAGYKDRNIFGTGRIFRVDSLFSTKGRSLEFGVSDPWFLGTDITLGLPFHYRFRTEPAFTMESSGVDVYLQKIIHKNVTVNVGYLYSKEVVSDILPDVDLEGLPTNYNTAALSFQLTRDTRDDLFFPSQGYRGNVSLALARPEFGGTIAYNRLVTGVRYFYPLSKESILGVRFRTGMILPTADQQSIPVAERFFNGGESSVRSFQASKLGPVDDSGDPLGGTAYSVYTVEWRKKLTDDLGWSIFWDMGNVSPNRTRVDGSSPLASDADNLISATWNDYFTDFRSGVGTGLQYMLPVGPARLDWAFNPSPDEERNEEDYVIHFSIGMAF